MIRWIQKRAAVALALLAVAVVFVPHPALAGSTSGNGIDLTSAASGITGLLDSVLKFGGWAIGAFGVAALGGGVLGSMRDPKHAEIYHHVVNYAGGAALGGAIVATGGPALITAMSNITGAMLH